MIIKIKVIIEDDDTLHRVLNFEEHFITWIIERCGVPSDDIDVGVTVNKTKNRVIRWVHLLNREYGFSKQVRKLYKEANIKRVSITEFSDEGDPLQ